MIIYAKFYSLEVEPVEPVQITSTEVMPIEKT